MIGIFTRNLDEEVLASNRLAFQTIDNDNSGQLDLEEMQLAMVEVN